MVLSLLGEFGVFETVDLNAHLRLQGVSLLQQKLDVGEVFDGGCTTLFGVFLGWLRRF